MRALIVGAGLMGQGIAIEVARGTESVTLYDISEDVLKRARKGIVKTLETLSRYRIADESLISRIQFTTSLSDGSDADVVFEAVPEDATLKGRVLGEIEATVERQVPICTNTSIMRVSDLSRFLKARDRFLGVHWMNPPHVMPLVEVVVGEHTDSGVVGEVKSFLERIGKTVVVCREQSMVNRFSAAVLSEAVRIMENDGADFRDIDTVWRYHLGLLYTLFGPFGNLDFIGLDTVFLASRYLHSLGESTPPEWLAEKVERGELGIKTGRGIYQYGRTQEELLSLRTEKILGLLRFLKGLEE
ncbi:3-hydroxyacyl-CoA dehydrogenase family protein [Geoglobus sp.]